MTAPQQSACAALAALVAYPDDAYGRRVAAGLAAVDSADAAAAEPLATFAKWAEPASTSLLQEQFIQTFDFNPACALEAGWHLYGENYERGAFLIKIRQDLRECGIPESTELPDHLAHLLALVARLDASRARALITDAVAPAIDRMRRALDGGDSPFNGLLASIQILLDGIVREDPAGVCA